MTLIWKLNTALFPWFINANLRRLGIFIYNIQVNSEVKILKTFKPDMHLKSLLNFADRRYVLRQSVITLARKKEHTYRK